MTRAIGLILAAMLATLLFYLSAWWPFTLWSRDGLLGVEALRPQGDLLAVWLRGTPFAPFDEIVWLCGAMLVLTGVQSVWARIVRRG